MFPSYSFLIFSLFEFILHNIFACSVQSPSIIIFNLFEFILQNIFTSRVQSPHSSQLYFLVSYIYFRVYSLCYLPYVHSPNSFSIFTLQLRSPYLLSKFVLHIYPPSSFSIFTLQIHSPFILFKFSYLLFVLFN